MKKRLLPDGRIHCPDCSKRARKPIYKPAAAFGKRGDGIQTYCKTCAAARVRGQRRRPRPSIWPRLETELHCQRQEVLLKQWPTPPGRTD